VHGGPKQPKSTARRVEAATLLRLLRRPTPTGPFSSLSIGLVADELTSSCFKRECRVLELTPANYAKTLTSERPDLLFVESAWSGLRNKWKYCIAAYPGHPERTNDQLARVVQQARDLRIPTVFWNKEDGVHFDRFIDSARLFDVVFTVDANCIPRYRERVPSSVKVAALPFAVQPALHRYTGISPRRSGACFVGSYSQHIHDERRARQDMLFETAASALGLTVHDRNSDRRGAHYRYPVYPGLRVRPKVPHEHTAAIYKSHLASLNVNTIEDSETMFSRRLIEIIACGGLAVSTPALAIEHLFRGFCHVVNSRDDAQPLFERLAREGYNAQDLEMIEAGAQHVAQYHTYVQRIETILTMVDSVRR